MNRKLLIMIGVSIVAVTMLPVLETSGQEAKQKKKAKNIEKKANVLVIRNEGDRSDQDHIVDFLIRSGNDESEHRVEHKKSGENVFFFHKHDDDKGDQDKGGHQKKSFKWNFKTKDGDESKQSHETIHIRELNDEDGLSAKRIHRIELGKGKDQSYWVAKDGTTFKVFKSRGTQKSGGDEKPHSHDGDEHGSHDEHGEHGDHGAHKELGDHGENSEHGEHSGHGEHGEHSGHGEHEEHGEHGEHGDHGGHTGLHERHADLHFDGAADIHELIHKALKEHGLSMEDGDVDVEVHKSKDGKTQIRIHARKADGNASHKKRIEKRIELRVEHGDGPHEAHSSHGDREVHEFKIKRKDDSDSAHRQIEKRVEKRRVIDRAADKKMNVELKVVNEGERKRAGSDEPKRVKRRIVSDLLRDERVGPGMVNSESDRARARGRDATRGSDRGPANFDGRLVRVERQLRSLEHKIDILIRKLDTPPRGPGPRGPGPRGTQNRPRRGNDRD